MNLAGISSIPFTPLPGRISSFTAQPQLQQVRLQWQVNASEANTGYELERRSSVGNFHSIAKAKSSALNGLYSYTDNTVHTNGHYYYRLKITELSGAVQYSNVLVVNTGNNRQRVKVYPTVVNGNNLTVQVPAGVYALQLINNAGQVVFNQPLMAGVQQVALPALTKGIYTYRLYDSKGTGHTTIGQLVFQ